MGLGDDIKNKAQEVGGKIKEGVGSASDNERLEAEGKADQAKAKAISAPRMKGMRQPHCT